jgi:hypothetical protein
MGIRIVLFSLTKVEVLLKIPTTEVNRILHRRKNRKEICSNISKDFQDE